MVNQGMTIMEADNVSNAVIKIEETKYDKQIFIN